MRTVDYHAAGGPFRIVIGGVAELTHDSIVGARFLCRVLGETNVDGGKAVITEIDGTAFRTGEHRFVLDPRDTLGTGFVLR